MHLGHSPRFGKKTTLFERHPRHVCSVTFRALRAVHNSKCVRINVSMSDRLCPSVRVRIRVVQVSLWCCSVCFCLGAARGHSHSPRVTHQTHPGPLDVTCTSRPSTLAPSSTMRHATRDSEPDALSLSVTSGSLRLHLCASHEAHPCGPNGRALRGPSGVRQLCDQLEKAKCQVVATDI